GSRDGGCACAALSSAADRWPQRMRGVTHQLRPAGQHEKEVEDAGSDLWPWPQPPAGTNTSFISRSHDFNGSASKPSIVGVKCRSVPCKLLPLFSSSSMKGTSW